MNFFSRTSDIISRNLAELLAKEANPAKAIRQVIAEMEQGLSGVRRSVQTADRNEQKVATELAEHRGQVAFWGGRAREELAAGQETEARAALIRRKELEDLIAGLQQEHSAAEATREQLTTTLRAVEARVAEARRLQAHLDQGIPLPAATEAGSLPAVQETLDRSRNAQVDDELEALKRELKLA